MAKKASRRRAQRKPAASRKRATKTAKRTRKAARASKKKATKRAARRGARKPARAARPRKASALERERRSLPEATLAAPAAAIPSAPPSMSSSSRVTGGDVDRGWPNTSGGGGGSDNW